MYVLEVFGNNSRSATGRTSVVVNCYGFNPSYEQLGGSVEYLSDDGGSSTGKVRFVIQPRFQRFSFPSDMDDYYALAQILCMRFVWVRFRQYETGGLPSAIAVGDTATIYPAMVLETIATDHNDEFAYKQINAKMRVFV
jgi:hypothetical protein